MADTTTSPSAPNDSAGQGRRLRMFRPSNYGPNAAQSGSMTILARSRHAVRNNPWAGTTIERSVSNGIGTGIQARPTWGDVAQKQAQRDLWKRTIRKIDADNVLDFYGLQALAWREWKEAGEVFVRRRDRRLEDGLPVPMQIQLIESEQCPRDFTRLGSNGNRIEQGIEFDKIGRRVAYWMHPRHPGDDATWMVSNEPVRIPADQILHLYRPPRAGAIRGIPDLAAVLVNLFNLDTLNDAVLERQKIANLFTGFFRRDASADTNDSVTAALTTGTDTDDTPLAGLEPGTMQELPDGVEVDFSQPPAPGDTYSEFIRAGLMAVFARLGIPYEIATGDIRNISDRALKLILSEFKRLIEMDQWLYMIPQLCQGVREWWFDAAVLSGALAVPGYADIREEVINSTTWVAQGWPYSHPVQDVTSDIKAIRAGLRTRSAVVMGAGEDPEEVDAQQVEDNQRADDSGLSYDSDGRRPLNQPATQNANPNQDQGNTP